jgi:outer membrane lipoprotein LolB
VIPDGWSTSTVTGWRRRRLLAAVLATVSAGLTACATRPPALAGDALSGRLSVRVAASGGQAERAANMAFELRGNPDAGAIDFSTPLGSIVAQARWSPGRVVLVTPQGERAFPDLDSLSREALGEAVPVAALFDWLRGRPWPGAPHQAQGEAPGFSQLGWQVDLAQFAAGQVTARRAQAPAVTVRAVLDRDAP